MESKDGIFDTTNLKKKVRNSIERLRKLVDEKKWDGYQAELLRLEDYRSIIKERQRLGAIVKKDWIEKKEVEKIIDKLNIIFIKGIKPRYKEYMELYEKGKKELGI